MGTARIPLSIEVVGQPWYHPTYSTRVLDVEVKGPAGLVRTWIGIGYLSYYWWPLEELLEGYLEQAQANGHAKQKLSQDTLRTLFGMDWVNQAPACLEEVRAKAWDERASCSRVGH